MLLAASVAKGNASSGRLAAAEERAHAPMVSLSDHGDGEEAQEAHTLYAWRGAKPMTSRSDVREPSALARMKPVRAMIGSLRWIFRD